MSPGGSTVSSDRLACAPEQRNLVGLVRAGNRVGVRRILAPYKWGWPPLETQAVLLVSWVTVHFLPALLTTSVGNSSRICRSKLLAKSGLCSPSSGYRQSAVNAWRAQIGSSTIASSTSRGCVCSAQIPRLLPLRSRDAPFFPWGTTRLRV